MTFSKDYDDYESDSDDEFYDNRDQVETRALLEVLERGGPLETKVTSRGFTPLALAASRGDLEAAQRLVQLGANLSAPAVGDRTPLGAAAQEGHLDMVRYLVEQGASLEERGMAARTPLHAAIIGKHVEVMEYLATQGADLNATSFGETPLHSAVGWRNIAAIRFLLERGVNVDAVDCKQCTALHHAAQLDPAWPGVSKITQILLEYGARVDLENQEGWTALHCR